MRFVIALFILLLINSCQRRQQADVIGPSAIDSITLADDEVDHRIEKEEQLRKLLINRVDVDSLISAIVPQHNVKKIATLSTTWQNDTQVIVDDSVKYKFTLSLSHNSKGESNTVLYYGQHKVDFKNYGVTCYKNKATPRCGFGYNFDNTIREAQVIEVCGLQYLYASIYHNCVGKGCGMELTLIYDLQTYTPTFVQAYRVPFEGYYLSDFNDDNKPDLLLAECDHDGTNMVFGVDEFSYTLTAFTYNKGQFIPLPYAYDEPAGFTLYGFGDYDRSYASVIDKHWFR